ncbi:FAD-dependent oxidoreductase [Chloroflexota bacterium]
MTELRRIFEPSRIGNVKTKNRVIMAATAPGLADKGFVTDRMIDFYASRAKGEIGLIIVGGCHMIEYVSDVDDRMMSIWEDDFVAGLQKLTDMIHANGAKIALQLLHRGHEAHRTPNKAVGPSAAIVAGYHVRELSVDEINDLIDDFATSALRAQCAGFDAVEIHGAHGYLVGNFLSPLTNHRADEWGGSVENRTRFGREIISRIKQKTGHDFPVVFRMAGAEYVENGITLEDALQQAPLLVQAGADALSITGGVGEANHYIFATYLQPDGILVPLAEAVKKVVNVPIIAVGKIHDPILAEQVLVEGKADFIAIARQFLTDPEWLIKAKEGRIHDIERCLCCNMCLDEERVAKGLGITCVINPTVCREKEFALKPIPSPKKVMIIGGGPAGMEAAITLAIRGHYVSLYERSHQLGGRWNVASLQEHKRYYAWLTEHMEAKLDKLGVVVFLGREGTRSLVDAEKPDVVIIATGATSGTLNIPGSNNKNVVQAVDVITRQAKTGKNVVVVGGRYIGMETALSLANEGGEVCLVEMKRVGWGVQRQVRRVLRNRLSEANVRIIDQALVVQIKKDGVGISKDGKIEFLKADTVVLAVGAQPENKCIEELKGAASQVYAIGDCVEPRDIMSAIHEGADVGLAI